MEQQEDQFEPLMRLPEGYEWAHKPSIRAQEIMQLRQSVGWKPGVEAIWMGCLDMAVSVRAVRLKASGQLVGIGFLVGNGRHAILCDLCVHPDHQGQRIGLAILAARLADAELLGNIPYLYSSIAAKNPLKNVYEQFGFQSSNGDAGLMLFRAKNI